MRPSTGSIAANFLCGVVDSYTTTKPVSLNVQMSNLITRFQKTSEQLDVDLEKANAKLNKEFNKILEDSTSIAASETVSDVKAKLEELNLVVNKIEINH